MLSILHIQAVRDEEEMPAFWEGVLAGYGIAIPVGAIAILIVDMGLRRGFKPAFMAGAGAASADFLYAALAALAGEAASALLAPWASPLRIASGLLLCMIGTYGLWRSRMLFRQQIQIMPAVTLQAVGDPARTYTQFLGLTLLNPLTVAYFGALILGRGAASATTFGARVTFVIGAAVASVSWQTLLAGAGALGHRRLSPRLQVALTLIGNLVVFGLGLRILVMVLVAG